MHPSVRPDVLIADDQPGVLLALELLLKSQAIATRLADSPQSLLASLDASPAALVLMDLNYTRDTTSGQEGLDLLARIARLPAPPPVVVMTAWGSVELAVEAMRRGARDFVMKPWDNTRLLEIVKAHLAAPAPPALTLDRDLAIARRVQERLFPASPRRTRHLRLAAYCRPAGAVGGDYYDFLELAPGRTGLVLADLSGKGIGAALLMANLQATLRSLAWQAAQSLPLLLRTVNLLLRESTAPEHFATLMFGDWDDQRRVLRYANCGHPPALVLRAAGGVEMLEPTAPVLGVLEAWTAAIEEAALAPGDRLVFSSDGVLECPAGDGAEVGMDGLIAMLERHRSTPIEDLPRLLLEELAAHAPHGLADDATLLCAEVE